MPDTSATRLDLSYPGLLKVALPMCFGALVQFVVAFTDNYFVSQLDGTAMSAVAYVGLIYITLAMIGYGLGNAAQILVARRQGEGKFGDVGEVTANAFWIGVLTALIQVALLYAATPLILDAVIESPDVLRYMKEFIPWRSFGFCFYTLTIILNSFWSGIATTRVMAYTTLITACVNVGLDYLLIFGHFGFPRMEVSGAALATMISEACAFVFLVAYTLRHPQMKVYRLWHHITAVPVRHTAAIIRLGGPIILQLFLSLFVWVVFYSLVENLGEASLQSAFVIRNMYMLAWVSVMGMSTTAKTYVSGLIAEGRQSELGKVVRRLALLNCLGILLLTHGLLLYPEWIAGIFTHDDRVIRYTIDSAYIVWPAAMIFGLTSILLATVEGSGNTLAGFLIELITTGFYLVTAWYLAKELHLPVHLVWMADYVYFISLGLLSFAYLKNGRWKWKHI